MNSMNLFQLSPAEDMTRNDQTGINWPYAPVIEFSGGGITRVIKQ